MPDSGLTRGEALALVPVKNRDVGESATAQGLIQLSLPVAVRPVLSGLARRLGLWDGRVLRKTVELDVLGTAVWRAIDGQASVAVIAAGLAREYRLDAREAELAVAQFLRQLGRRGAIGVAGRDGRKGEEKG